MKIAVFENEYTQIESAFKAVNLLYFNNNLTIDTFPTSQSLKPFEDIQNYELVIVDIDLSTKSEMDGFELISKINMLFKTPKIIILTGHSKVNEKLKEKNLPSYPIVQKPIDFKL